jgi:hypothetical protein
MPYQNWYSLMQIKLPVGSDRIAFIRHQSLPEGQLPRRALGPRGLKPVSCVNKRETNTLPDEPQPPRQHHHGTGIFVRGKPRALSLAALK